MHLTGFLSRVLPVEGYKCWVEINKRKKVIQGFAATYEELAQKLLEVDSRGSDAYFACASFKTADNRKQANALCAKSFWLDIDTKESKPNAFYDTVEDAVQACDEFCNRVGLPFAAVVRSGGGLHAYFMLSTPVEASVWMRAATRFKQLTESHGLHADPARTADLASILRPPGTRNWKLPSNPRPVVIDGEDGFESLDAGQFIETLLSIPLHSGKPAPAGAHAPALVSNEALLAGVSKAFDHTKGVAQGSRGYNRVRYAGELVAKGLSEDEVMAKLMAWDALCSPPEGEAACRHSCKSAFNMHAQKHPAPVPPEEAKKLPSLPYKYRWGNQSQLEVQVEEIDASGAQVKTWKIVSPYPVYLAALLNREQGERHNSYLFRQFSVLDGWNEFCIDSETINSQSWYSAWFRHGGSIHRGMEKYFLTYVREAEIMLRATEEITRYNQFGWKDDYKAFLVGDVLFKGGVPSRAYGTEKLTPLMRTMLLPKEGSLEEWTAAADKFFAPSMEAHGFALLCSFAAPLMPFVAGMGDGGSILSFVSDDSGHGKTPIAEAFASVWGEIASTLVTGSFTEHRRHETVVRHCHLPQVQEEMTQSDPVIAAESIKKFTTGTDRGRLDRGGGAKEVPERYQTILLSISNISLYDMVKQVDRAASRRILEIAVPRPDDPVFANLGGVTREMVRCRAYAGRRWAQILTSRGIVEYLKENLTGLTQEQAGVVVMQYRKILRSEAEHRFIVWLLSVVDVAATLLVHYGVLHFDVDRIMKWAIEQARERTCEFDDTSSAESKLQRFLSDNVANCLVVSGPFIKGKQPCVVHTEPRNHLYMRLEIETRRLYISNDAMQRWCVKNRESFVRLGKALHEKKIVLERSKKTTLGAGAGVASVSCYCWEVDMEHPSVSGVLREVETAAQAK